MKKSLSQFQRGYGHHRLTFVADLLSLELTEALRRTSLACAENRKKRAGIVELVCGLYLQDRDEIVKHFQGDLATVVGRIFPIHRFGREGLFGKQMLDALASDSDEHAAFGYPLDYEDDVLRLLWLSARLAGAVGKSTSMKDAIAAISLDPEWIEKLARGGLTLNGQLPDFDQEIKTIIFYATPHTGEGWPKELDFQFNKEFDPPYKLAVVTPSGPFQPVRSARVKLNGAPLAIVEWPDRPKTVVEVELRNSNKIEVEMEGPQFGSLELIVRGVLG